MDHPRSARWEEVNYGETAEPGKIWNKEECLLILILLVIFPNKMESAVQEDHGIIFPDADLALVTIVSYTPYQWYNPTPVGYLSLKRDASRIGLLTCYNV